MGAERTERFLACSSAVRHVRAKLCTRDETVTVLVKLLEPNLHVSVCYLRVLHRDAHRRERELELLGVNLVVAIGRTARTSYCAWTLTSPSMRMPPMVLPRCAANIAPRFLAALA